MDAKGAAEHANRYLNELYGFGKIQDLLLEEVEKMLNGNRWRVTLSFTRPSEADSLKQALSGTPPPRHYKVVEIDGDTAQMLSMRMPKND